VVVHQIHPGRALDGPRLELDQLLAQLIDRAQDVMAAQNRLRGLLEANRSIIGDLGLETVLRRIVEAACELVDARYGALGVVAPRVPGSSSSSMSASRRPRSSRLVSFPRARACWAS